MLKMILFAKQKQRYRHRGQKYGHQGERGDGMKGEIGIDIYILLCVKQITNENPPDSSREPYSVLCGDLNGKEIQKRGNICIHIVIHFAVQQKQTQHSKATIHQKNSKKKKTYMCFKQQLLEWLPIYLKIKSQQGFSPVQFSHSVASDSATP